MNIIEKCKRDSVITAIVISLCVGGLTYVGYDINKKRSESTSVSQKNIENDFTYEIEKDSDGNYLVIEYQEVNYQKYTDKATGVTRYNAPSYLDIEEVDGKAFLINRYVVREDKVYLTNDQFNYLSETNEEVSDRVMDAIYNSYSLKKVIN